MKVIVDEVRVEYSNHKMKRQLFLHLRCDKYCPLALRCKSAVEFLKLNLQFEKQELEGRDLL